MNKPLDPDVVREAEDLREAIIRGELDAFVVGRDDGRHVLLLANAYQRYRQLVERMQQGAITLSGDGRVLYANQRFADMLSVALSEIYSVPLDNYVGVADRARLGDFLRTTARNSRLELELRRRDGVAIPVALAHVSFADGYSTLLVTDLRPWQWPSLTMNVLDLMRASLDQLNRSAGLEQEEREALGSLGEQINGLARLIDQMIDVQGRQP